MSEVIEKYVNFMVKIAIDQSHGYSQDQDRRWGSPDYDCSSLVISALEYAGIKAKSAGASFTGNMAAVLTNLGFSNVVKKVDLSSGSGMQRGDILMYHKYDNIGHTAVYQGSGKIVHARGKSYGSAAPGDQGTEIQADCAYYNPGWQYVFRYKAAPVSGSGATASTKTPKLKENYASTCVVTLRDLVPGSTGRYVKLAQYLLNKAGFKGADGKKLSVDGEFGDNTAYAVTSLQKKVGMTGIWFGTMSSATWTHLIEQAFKS